MMYIISPTHILYIISLTLIYYINFFYSRKLTSQIKNDLNTHIYIYKHIRSKYIYIYI